ncbi:DNA alkylation repair protein [Flavobacterium sp.]|uniref:DNA alkylation repair protein n=1 Tax=Flavobacterium sp. TaxID=239 RepID=UPI0026043450|nr:DNA alkylation repair protein [Flavobacterium sp.]
MPPIDELVHLFKQHQKTENAVPMKAYMKDNFEFLGIKATQRRDLFNTWYAQNKKSIQDNFRAYTLVLFVQPYREFHYCGMELFYKAVKKKYLPEDIHLIEHLIITHSWWDSVDFIAKYLLGGYLKQFPETIPSVIERFSAAPSLWLNRSGILFQLGYKAQTDFDLLKAECYNHKDSKEFFIQKAIGWALRDYNRFNPNGVRDFVENTDLKPLSKREALRNLP